MAGAVNSDLTRRRKRARTSWLIGIAGMVVLLGLIFVGWQWLVMVDEINLELPTEIKTLANFPEMALDEGHFKPVWGEVDRGTWIFEYQEVKAEPAQQKLLEQAKAAGWTVVEEKPGEIRLRRKEAGTWRDHLIIHAKDDGVRVLIMRGEHSAWGDPKETDLPQDKFYKKNVERRFRAGIEP